MSAASSCSAGDCDFGMAIGLMARPLTGGECISYAASSAVPGAFFPASDPNVSPPQPLSDVLVIGGGPAGSTTAMLLARRGLTVTLLERDRHPRFHIGESLLPSNMPIIERLGLMPELERIGLL